MFLRPLFLATIILVTSVAAAIADTKLVMVEERGCIWCARWNDEISGIYPKTAEGAAAPLFRMDIHATRPAGITFERSLTFTPTFVLVVDGLEVSRLEGYPGEDFFWGILGQMLARADVDISG